MGLFLNYLPIVFGEVMIMSKRDRSGNKRAARNVATRKPVLGYYLIVTDTEETENNYFEGIRNALPEDIRNKIIIKVFRSRTDKLVEACHTCMKELPHIVKPWIVLDRDQVENFNNIISKAESKGIKVGWSNPCIEIWFDAYFGNMHNYQTSVECCKKFSKQFKKITNKEYEKSDSEIYVLLKEYGDETSAIKIADLKLQQHLKDNNNIPADMIPCTKVHLLVNEIREKVNKNNY